MTASLEDKLCLPRVSRADPRRAHFGCDAGENSSSGERGICSNIAVDAQMVPSTARSTKVASSRLVSTIPSEILEDVELNKAISCLPSGYNFEIHKCIHQLRRQGATRVALQMPEGLLRFSLRLADIFERFCSVETLIMGDVTYGACCIDDFTAIALGADFMIHYGHSCLVPVSVTKIRTLYVFVDIQIEQEHLVNLVARNFEKKTRLALVSTVQFIASVQMIKQKLMAEGYSVIVPQAKPLSPGEILGCTAPRLYDAVDAFIYVGDGRFHLEAMMIANPAIAAYRYDPYVQKCTREHYEHDVMRSARHAAIEKARAAKRFGLILGTLGRQGSPKILEDLKDQLAARGIDCIVVLMSEIRPERLGKFKDIDAWIQIACPRLSIDWGHTFDRPLLSPYEMNVVFGKDDAAWTHEKPYPMDYYAKESGGPWTNYYKSSVINNPN